MYDPNAEGVFGNVQGGYTVTIMPNANNRVYYMLSLSVSRMGMAPNPADFKPLEKMNKVFERLYRAKRSRQFPCEALRK